MVYGHSDGCCSLLLRTEVRRHYVPPVDDFSKLGSLLPHLSLVFPSTFWNWVSLCSSGWLWIPVSASQVLELQVGLIMPGGNTFKREHFYLIVLSDNRGKLRSLHSKASIKSKVCTFSIAFSLSVKKGVHVFIRIWSGNFNRYNNLNIEWQLTVIFLDKQEWQHGSVL